MVKLSLNNLVKKYQGRQVVKSVSLSTESGAVTGLLGPNGAGKTTLLRCLAGLDQPFSGHITIDNIDVIENPKLAHQKIGYLSDFFGKYFHAGPQFLVNKPRQ